MAEVLTKVDNLALTKRDHQKTSAVGGVLTVLTPLVCLAALIVLAATPDTIVVDEYDATIDATTPFPITFSVADRSDAQKATTPNGAPARYVVIIDRACAAANGWQEYTLLSHTGGAVNSGFCGLGFVVTRNVANTSAGFCYPNPSNPSEDYLGVTMDARYFAQPGLYALEEPLLMNGQAVPLVKTLISYRISRFTDVHGVRSITQISPGLVSMGIANSTDSRLPFVGKYDGSPALPFAQQFCPEKNYASFSYVNVRWYTSFLPSYAVRERVEKRVGQKSAIAAQIGGAWQLIFSVFAGLATVWLKIRPKFGLA